jgi:hypothetical protein
MRLKRSFWSSLIIGGMLAGLLFGGAAGAAAADEAPRIGKDQLKGKIGSAQVTIIDVRAGKDWNASGKKIKGAVREDPDKVETWAKKHRQDQELVLYCA